MSDKDHPVSGIFVADSTRTDPVYASRQMLETLLEFFPTEKELQQRAHHVASMSVPSFQMPGAPAWVNEAMATAQATTREMLAMPAVMSGQFISREAMHRAIMSNPHFVKWLSSREAAHWMWKQGDPKGEPDEIVKYNNALYTHDEDGTLNRVKSDDLVKHFQKPQDEWPAQIILTSNHARTQGSKDISDIMRNEAALVRNRLPEGVFDLERHPESAQTVAGKSIVLSAVHAEDTSLRNGADLMFRNIYLREHHTLDERVRPNSAPDISARDIPIPRFMSNASAEEKLDAQLVEFEHRAMSPAAIRLAKLMLKCMLENPQQVDVDETRTFKDLQEDEEFNDQPLVLRHDAAAIANRFTMIGHSKAANTVNCAMRHLLFELSSRGIDGTPMFSQRDPQGLLIPMETEEQVARITRKIGLIGSQGPGVLLTEEEKRLGMYRLRINNRHDLVAGHFSRTDGSELTADAHDVVVTVDGTPKGLGHDQHDAMGIKTTVGYIHNSPEAGYMVDKVLYPKYGLPVPPMPLSVKYGGSKDDEIGFAALTR